MNELQNYITLADLALAVFSIWILWRRFSPRKSFTDNPLVFFILIFISMLILRWPLISWPHEINIDESQMLAQGMRYLSHPIPWRDVDGTTGGPLNSMILSLPLSLGSPSTWETSRIMLWVLNCLTMVFLYFAVRCFGSPAESQFVLLPAIYFYAFSFEPHYAFYSSETLPVLMLSAGLCLLAQEWRATRPSVTRWFFVGLTLGAVPLAKLQASPLALFLAGVGFMQLLLLRRKDPGTPRSGLMPIAALILGGLLIPGLLLGIVTAKGAFGDFWKSYILASRSYAEQTSWGFRIHSMKNILLMSPHFTVYLAINVAAALLWLFARQRGKKRASAEFFWPLLIIAADLILSVLCILAAGKGFPHYLLLLVPPLTLLFALLFFAGKQVLSVPDNPPTTASILKFWPLIFSALTLSLLCMQSRDYTRQCNTFLAGTELGNKSLVAQQVAKAIRPGDTLSVWGWMPMYHVETGALPATRDAIGHYIISPGPLQEYFQKRYLTDLTKSRPAIFIDAVADSTFCWTWTDDNIHESFPALTAFINENYSLWVSIQLKKKTLIASPVRIYVLKERMHELHLVPTRLETDEE